MKLVAEASPYTHAAVANGRIPACDALSEEHANAFPDSTPAHARADSSPGMETGSRYLAHQLSVYVACLAFAVTFLATCALGGGLNAALMRGAIATAAALLVGRLVLTAVLEAIFTAMARDRATEHAAEKTGGDA